jgi:nicotinamide mononucleotide (NMN) deamidase PncC
MLARDRFQANIGIGIDGFIESNEGTVTGKAFIAISCPQGDHNITQTYPAGSYQLARRSIMHAFFSLQKVLLEI